MAAADSYIDGGRLSPLSTPSVTRAVLEAHGIGTKYTLGQNFLVNDDVLRKIVDLAEVGEEDRVLEVGPGIGTLTIALLKHAAAVVAVERDPDLPAVLSDTLHPWRDKFALIEKDALDVTAGNVEAAMREIASTKAECGGGVGRLDRAGSVATEAVRRGVPLSEDCLSESGCLAPPTREGLQLQLPNKLVSNLPYAVAATVVLDYFQKFPSIDSATVMVQKEVADRMAAERGTKSYGAYTVKLGLYAEPVGRFGVGPGNFFPPPRVESAVIRLNRRVPLGGEGRPVSAEVVTAACTMADAAFANRRKTLSNSCKTYFMSRGQAGKRVAARLPELFGAADIDARRRGETLTQAEFIRLGQTLLAIAETSGLSSGD